MPEHVSQALLEEALELIRQSPGSSGVVEMIVRRPVVNEREVLQQGELSIDLGLLGDNWANSWPAKVERHRRHRDMQINLMNSRVIDTICAGDRQRWPLAGDQLFVDFDLSEDNLPAGTKIQVGEAVLEVNSEPHLGCKKFERRFGRDAVTFVNSALGKLLKLRGVNARVISPGVVTTGGVISKLAPF